MVKKVLLESTWLTMAESHNFFTAPPEGYEFIQAGDVHTSEQKFFKAASSFGLVRNVFLKADSVIPMTLLRSFLFQRWTGIPNDMVLTFAIQHPVFRREPWVVEVETPHFLIGKSARHLSRYRKFIERILASPYCKKILCWSLASHKSFLTQLDCQPFLDKFEIIPMAVPSKLNLPPKDYSASRPVKLLFLGSMRTLDPWHQFIIKGGREAVQTFIELHRKYPDLQMVIKAGLPDSLKKRYEGIPNLKIIDKFIPRNELEYEYRTADIFLSPSYNTTPHTLLDAMSCELAVVSLNNWANSEYVLDGETGLLAEPDCKVPWELCGTPEYYEKIREPRQEVVNQLVEKTSLLVENVELRRRLAQNGRYEAE
jgi:glycosyltransferase involved in cell wall biosynthesis